MTMQHLEEFITLYNSDNLDKRKETWSEENEEGRWRKYTYDEIIVRDKTSLDIFWLRDKSLTDPDILAAEIIENIEAGLNSFKDIMEVLEAEPEE